MYFQVLSVVLFLVPSCTYALNVMIPSVEEYFPSLNGSLLGIEWMHATNDQEKLKAGLLDGTIHMLEADIVFGYLVNGSGPMPVMGHPPQEVSDLSLEEFVSAVIQAQTYTKKGIKLDFKSDIAYNASCLILEKLKEKLTFPVWLNADILAGPLKPTSVPLDAANFVSKAMQYLPDAPLSLGWTTAFQVNATYSSEMLEAMFHVVTNQMVTSPITLAVRAAFSALAKSELFKLVQDIDGFQKNKQTTLTVWMSDANDIVDVPKLRDLLTLFGKRKIALDVPESLRDQLINPSLM